VIASLLSFVPWWGWSLSGLALTVAARVYLGQRAALAVLAVAALWTAYMGGVAHERGRGAVADLKAELAIARDDLAKAKRAETDAAGRAERLETASRSNQDIIDELAARLAAQQAEQQPVEPVPSHEPGGADPGPVAAPARACRCVLTESDDRFLRQIK
jgi:hypothetical protein